MTNQDNDAQYDIDFRDYSFPDQPGVFSYRLRKKLRSGKDRMTVFVDGDNGEKHQITLYPDSDYLGAKKLRAGARISVEFVCSKNGNVYARKIREET